MARFNPFVTKGYAGAEYFCDRVKETELLTGLLKSNDNVALMSPRRMGKTGLLLHCFQQECIKDDFYTFLIDIYHTKNLNEFVFEMGQSIMERLKSRGRKAVDKFLYCVASLRAGVSFDQWGNPSWGLEIGDINTPAITLKEIFHYLDTADKPCIVAIDEFQAVSKYPESNTEAVLRTYIQHCNNATFVFSGSQRQMMGQIFSSPARPFYQSTVTIALDSIAIDKYSEFIINHFETNGRHIQQEIITKVYEMFDGVTWYVQQMCNILFMLTQNKETCTIELLPEALKILLDSLDGTFSNLLFQLNERPKQLLIAIAKEGKVKGITSSEFIKKHRLLSSSSVQSSLKVLLEKELVTIENGSYMAYDKLFAIWINRQQ